MFSDSQCHKLTSSSAKDVTTVSQTYCTVHENKMMEDKKADKTFDHDYI